MFRAVQCQDRQSGTWVSAMRESCQVQLGLLRFTWKRNDTGPHALHLALYVKVPYAVGSK
jgi:hypothetical protein